MSLGLNYTLRHLVQRRTTTTLTVVGVALVVFVFAATLMLSHGLEETLQGTGTEGNVIVVRTGARNEIQSGVNREDTAAILADGDIARDAEGAPLATKDTVVLINLKKRADGQPSNVTLRGVSTAAYAIRDQVRLQQGRLPAPGTREVIVGNAIHRKFAGTNIGESLRMVGSNWEVVGIFDAGNTGFSSEIWGDTEVLLPAFRRERFSSITVRLRNGVAYEAFRDRLENDKRLSVTVKEETEFYAEQSRGLAIFIQAIGGVVSVIFSLGAVIGAVITMFSAVATRVREIGILRAIGFRPRSIFFTFAKECLVIALLGGILGVAFATLLSSREFSTTNFSTFSDVTFRFQMTPKIALIGVIFSLVMGIIGGVLPAWRASRIRLLDALRSV